MGKLIQKVRECSGEVLNLMCSGIGNDELRVVCKEMKHITSLKTLWLSGNRISDVTQLVGVVKRNPWLEVLMLGANRISDFTPLVEASKYSAFLRVLYLNNNRISDLSPLAEALKHNTSLKKLWLSNNQISDLSPLAEALKHNTSLEVLWLDNNPSNDNGDLKIIEDTVTFNRYNAPKRRMTLFEMMSKSGILHYPLPE